MQEGILSSLRRSVDLLAGTAFVGLWFVAGVLLGTILTSELSTVEWLSFSYWQHGGTGVSRSEVFRNLGLLIIAVIGLGFGIWRAVTAYLQIKTGQRQAETAEQGLITDRFTRANEQLGDERLPVRIGAIFALWRLSEDSPERDEVNIWRMLCAFVREPPHAEQAPEVDESNGDDGALPEQSAREDLQIILQLFGQAASARGRLQRGFSLDFHHAGLTRLKVYAANFSAADFSQADLRSSYLSGGSFAGASFREADLLGAHLSRTDFRGANFYKANLVNVIADNANFTNASLLEASLRGAWLHSSNFTNAMLYRAYLYNATLYGSILHKADLAAANLTNADLGSANLSETRINEADLSGAVLSGADLSGAVLERANCRETNLSEADFTSANLGFADLNMANLTGANLSEANLDGAILVWADLSGADFSGANLSGADFFDANLSRVNFLEVQNLSQQQLDDACGSEPPINLPDDLVWKETIDGKDRACPVRE